MSKFAVGDRVAVYGALRDTPLKIRREVGIVIHVYISGTLEIMEAGTDYRFWVHEKQCRRLKPKRKPREFWITNHPTSIEARNVYDNEPTHALADRWELIHVREVLE